MKCPKCRGLHSPGYCDAWNWHRDIVSPARSPIFYIPAAIGGVIGIILAIMGY